ncbi:uncharacterized protein METZ01_LOCUS201807, partial [marine metagenome]
VARARRKFELVDIARALAKSVARLEDGKPASPVGELIDAIVKEVETTNQYTSTAPAGRRQTGQGRDNIVPYLFS